jgi:hypothetical protein
MSKSTWGNVQRLMSWKDLYVSFFGQELSIWSVVASTTMLYWGMSWRVNVAPVRGQCVEARQRRRSTTTIAIAIAISIACGGFYVNLVMRVVLQVMGRMPQLIRQGH